MGKKKRGNYNQDYFKGAAACSPGDIVQERQKRRLTQQEEEKKPRPAKADEPAIPQ